MKREEVVKTLDYILKGWEKGEDIWTLTTKKRGVIAQYKFELAETDEVLRISWNREINAEIELRNLWKMDMDNCGFFSVQTYSFSIIKALLPDVKIRGTK